MRRTADERRSRGFLLLEALLALTLIGFALLLAVVLLGTEARFREAGQARSRVLAAEEDVLELLRSGTLRLEPATFEEEELEHLLDRPLPPTTLWIEVDPTSTSGLLDVAVSARYVAGRRLRTVRLATRMRGP